MPKSQLLDDPDKLITIKVGDEVVFCGRVLDAYADPYVGDQVKLVLDCSSYNGIPNHLKMGDEEIENSKVVLEFYPTINKGE